MCACPHTSITMLLLGLQGLLAANWFFAFNLLFSNLFFNAVVLGLLDQLLIQTESPGS